MSVPDRCWYCWVKAGKSVKATHLILLDHPPGIEAVCDKCDGDILETVLRQPCSDPTSERRLLDILAVREVMRS